MAFEPVSFETTPPLVSTPWMVRIREECGPQLNVRQRDGKLIEVFVHSLPGAVVAGELLQMMSWNPRTETPQPPTMLPMVSPCSSTPT